MAVVRDHSRKFRKELDQRMEKALHRVGVVLVTSVQKSMRQGGGSEGLRSSPGEPPYVQTGTLRKSIRYEVVRQGNALVLRYGSNEDYARRLELGFAGADSIGRVYAQAARPYLRPALKREKNAIGRMLRGS